MGNSSNGIDQHYRQIKNEYINVLKKSQIRFAKRRFDGINENIRSRSTSFISNEEEEM